MSLIEELLQAVKEKKELQGISSSLISELIEKQIKRYPVRDFTKKEKKLIVKSVRADLRLYAGRFRVSTQDRKKMLEEKDYDKLLNTHSSTAERMSEYPFIKELMVKLKVKSILDLGCGLNPIALADKSKEYIASDINEDDLSIVSTFFKKNKIKKRVFIHDLRKPLPQLPEVDLCILMKVLDIIEKKGHRLAEEVISNINSKYFLISFPTIKLSGKKMDHPRRFWIEKMLSRLGLKYQCIQRENEVLYIATKSELADLELASH